MAALLIGGIAMTGCKDNNTSGNQQSTTPTEQIEQQAGDMVMDSEGKKQVLDSINEMVSKNQETINNDIEYESKEVSDLKGASRLYDLISWVIAAIALLVAVISLIKLNSVQKRADRHRKDIGDLERRISILEQKTNVAPTRNRTANAEMGSSEYTTLASRIYKIEHQLNTMNHSSISERKNLSSSNPGSDASRFVNGQSGYFGLPTPMSFTKAYFKRLSDIPESDSRFTVEVKNDKAEFRPIEGSQYLNDLRSFDTIKMALDITGCAPSEANQMSVVLPGEAKKDGDRWIITKKATIALSR